MSVWDQTDKFRSEITELQRRQYEAMANSQKAIQYNERAKQSDCNDRPQMSRPTPTDTGGR